MKTVNRFLPFFFIASLFFTGCGGTDPGGSGSGSTIVADHTILNISNISQTALDNARKLRMSLSHASVGGYILGGMNTLSTSNTTRYSFPNWSWNERGNPSWQLKVDYFVDWVRLHQSEYDVFQMKFCYVDPDASFTYYRDAMLSLESTYPTKRFIWWTMPIFISGSDNAKRASFNNQVRSYCTQNNKPFYDIADIESHDASGNPVTEGGNEAMYSGWTDDGGHPNKSGAERMARAMWWIMTRIEN